jgi:hypothetical protein
MGAFAGPEIPNNNLIFSIDGRNLKCFSGNGKVKSTITQEEKNTTATQQDGYIYSNYGYIDKFTDFPIGNSSAITVNISLDNTLLKSGTVFSICNDISSSYRVSGISSYITGVSTTVSLASTSHSLNLNVSGISSYITGVSTTVSLASTSHSLNLNVSGISSYITGVTTTVSLASTSHSLNLDVSGISSYITGVTTTVSSAIFPSIFNPEFELSCTLYPTSILIVNKTSSDQTYLSQILDTQGKDIYSIVFRAPVINTSPITLYKNGNLLSNSGIKTTTGQFENVGISLFNLGNGSYSEYGIRLINVYNNELSQQDILLINNLKTN